MKHRKVATPSAFCRKYIQINWNTSLRKEVRSEVIIGRFVGLIVVLQFLASTCVGKELPNLCAVHSVFFDSTTNNTLVLFTQTVDGC